MESAENDVYHLPIQGTHICKDSIRRMSTTNNSKETNALPLNIEGWDQNH